MGNQLDPAALQDLAFELITHRYTKRAKENILALFPETELPMSEEERRIRYGQFGYIKYIYPEDTYKALKEFFFSEIENLFPSANISYFV